MSISIIEQAVIDVIGDATNSTFTTTVSGMDCNELASISKEISIDATLPFFEFIIFN